MFMAFLKLLYIQSTFGKMNISYALITYECSTNGWNNSKRYIVELDTYSRASTGTMHVF